MNLHKLLPEIRRQFPAFDRRVNGFPAAFLDGPAGTQVPMRVIDAITGYLTKTNANHGGLFATALESDALLDSAHQAFATFVGADDPDEIAFGANMTSLTFALSRALARTWKAGDEIIVTRLDHDANFTPWVLAARDAGAIVRVVDVRCDDGTLDVDDFRAKLSPRTRLVAVGCASNSVGTINPVAEIGHLAHQVGALVFLDAVHFAPHGLIDVRAWNCDFLACSAYKFFGPHIGVLWGRRSLLEKLEAYKVRPAPDALPGKWMTGTQSHEGIAGALAAVDYMMSLGRQLSGKNMSSSTERFSTKEGRDFLIAAYQAISAYERELAARILAGLATRPQWKVWGLTDPARLTERVATFSVTHATRTPAEIATALGERGLFVWHGNYYALNLSEALGREPHGMVRIGCVHYNTDEEIDRLFAALDAI